MTAAHSVVRVVVQGEKRVKFQATGLDPMSVSEVMSNFVKGGDPVSVDVPTRPGDSGDFLGCEGDRCPPEGEQEKNSGPSMHVENSEYNPPARIVPDQMPSGELFNPPRFHQPDSARFGTGFAGVRHAEYLDQIVTCMPSPDTPFSQSASVHPASLSSAELLKACIETRTRRSGPGGQHRNKTETAVVLLHQPTGIRAEASERRSQAENRRVALERLRLRLALEHRAPAAPAPSDRWCSRRRGRHLIVSTRHEDYPAVVAEALDQLVAHGVDMHRASEILGVTATQLLNVFRRSPPAWMAINRLRAEAELPRLR